LKLKLFAEANKEVALSIWNWRGPVTLSPNDVIVGFIKQNKFGYSCYQNKIFKIS